MIKLKMEVFEIVCLKIIFFILNPAPVVQSKLEVVSKLQWHDPCSATAEEQGVVAQLPDQVQMVASSHKYGSILDGNSTA